MIAKLTGIIEHVYDDHLILSISGVGYQIFCTSAILHSVIIGNVYSLFISTQIKDQQSILLFGFIDTSQKSLFTLLQSVTGISSKLALTILSHLSIDQFEQIMFKQNKDSLTMISGVGTKLAERILFELKNKIHLNNANRELNTSIENNNQSVTDAAAALCKLGINYTDALNTLNKISQPNPMLSVE